MGNEPRRGGPNGTWCLGNNEPDGNPFIANWNGVSVGCKTKSEADRMVQILRDQERERWRVK